MSRASEQFELELDLIKNSQIREMTLKMLEIAPEYFWVKPSSSTGKYHPEQSQGEGGLVRHTKAVVYMADELCRSEAIVEDERDAIISASLLHDICKYGLPDSKHTVSNHDYIGAFFVNAQTTKLGIEDTPMMKGILGGIAWHYGIWSKRPAGKDVKQYPDEYSRIERIVHLSDYIASRKELKFGFLEESSFIG